MQMKCALSCSTECSGRIEPRENRRTDQARLALAPIGARNDFLGRHQAQCQAVTIQEHFETQSIDGVDQQHDARTDRYFKLVSRRMAMATRSRAICCRRISASCSLASSTFSSKL